MKKAITIAAALIMITVPALADTDQIIQEYNLNTILTSATQLSGSPEISEKNGMTSYDFKVTDNVIVSISTKEGEIRVCGVICKDESDAAEFLAQCAASSSTIAGYDDLYYLYADILNLFLQTRAGETKEQQKAPKLGVVYQLTKEKFGYLFMIAR